MVDDIKAELISIFLHNNKMTRQEFCKKCGISV